jgi:hypothetical protein
MISAGTPGGYQVEVLREEFPGIEDDAALKVHKVHSVGYMAGPAGACRVKRPIAGTSVIVI